MNGTICDFAPQPTLQSNVVDEGDTDWKIPDATSRKGTDLGFKTAEETQVRYAKLDIADAASIQSLANSIKQDHKAVDVLINNAGVNLDDDYTTESVKTTLDTNVRGTSRVRVPSFARKSGS